MNRRMNISKRHEAGFGLVEIMVAVVISMLAMVFVLQIFSGSEAKKRATTGANDASMGGVLALAGLQRDLRQAGFGMTSLDLLGCDVTFPNNTTLSKLAPVTINHGSIPRENLRNDTLLIAYGAGDGTPEGDPINSQPDDDKYGVATLPGFQLNDFVLAQFAKRASPCNLRITQVTAPADPTRPYVTVGQGVTGMVAGRLYNLGQDSTGLRGPQVFAYRILAGNLVMCDYTVNDCSSTAAANWVTIASNIVSMRVQYGRDTNTPRDNVADIYDQVLLPTSATFACDAARIVAVRLVLVARSTEQDKDSVTTSTSLPVWEASTANNPGASAIAPIDVVTGATNWDKYRYKVFQTVVPIRTTSWLDTQPEKGCP